MSRAIATAHWRRLTGEGTDRCTLSRVDHGWLLSGQAIWRTNGAETALSYVVRCDPDWQSRSAEIVGSGPGGEIGLVLSRNGGGWTCNGRLQRGTAQCPDLDLGFTPATNLMPVRRLTAAGAQALEIRAAWMPEDLTGLRLMKQTYTANGPDAAVFTSPGFEARLALHDSGFVTRYPGLWDGWVDGG